MTPRLELAPARLTLIPVTLELKRGAGSVRYRPGARVVGARLPHRSLDSRLTNDRHRDYLSRYQEFADDPGRNVLLRVSTGL